MSKTLVKFFDAWASPEQLLAKLLNRTLTPGSRVVPPRVHDKAAQLRIDAGEKVGDKQNLYLQVNSEATSQALKDFRNKNGKESHGNLAVVAFNTKSENDAAEIERVVKEMLTQGKSKVG